MYGWRQHVSFCSVLMASVCHCGHRYSAVYVYASQRANCESFCEQMSFNGRCFIHWLACKQQKG